MTKSSRYGSYTDNWDSVQAKQEHLAVGLSVRVASGRQSPAAAGFVHVRRHLTTGTIRDVFLSEKHWAILCNSDQATRSPEKSNETKLYCMSPKAGRKREAENRNRWENWQTGSKSAGLGLMYQSCIKCKQTVLLNGRLSDSILKARPNQMPSGTNTP